MKTSRAILLAGLTVGTLDLIDAFVFFGLRSGARPMGILHSIAAGWIGRDAARAGGVTTATLGFFSHFMVAFIIAAIYVMASRALPLLRKQWLICGLAYGVVAYLVMNWFVVPLSAAGSGQITFALATGPVLLNGILIHMFGVGLPSAYFASKVRTSQSY